MPLRFHAWLIFVATSGVIVMILLLFRRSRHRSDPPCTEVTSPPAHSLSPQTSLSVGVSPATTLANHSSFSYGTEEQELTQKLESSLKKEKALSQRYCTDMQACNTYVSFLWRGVHSLGFWCSYPSIRRSGLAGNHCHGHTIATRPPTTSAKNFTTCHDNNYSNL